MKKHRIVFLDRDGVINVDLIGDYIKTWEEFKFEEGVLEGLKILSDHQFDIIIISNQAGIGDGVYTQEALWDIHEKMLREMQAHGIQVFASHYCLHGKKTGCPCRKPQTGLFKMAVEGISYDPQHTFFVGDKVTDIEAGKRFGLKTVLVKTGYGQDAEAKLSASLKPDFIVSNLKEAAQVIIQT